jgi:hypothetical protein
VDLADGLPVARAHGVTRGRRARHREQLPHLVADDQGLFHVACRGHGRVEDAVAEHERPAQRPVQQAPYAAAHHDGDGDDRPQPF